MIAAADRVSTVASWVLEAKLVTALPAEVTVTLSKGEVLLIIALTVELGVRDPRLDVAKAVFGKLIRAARRANGLDVA